jgi:hypothetical protein
VELDADIKKALRVGVDKKILVHRLRRKKIIIHYITLCHSRLDNINQKTYAIEQLNITKLQIDAIQETAYLFKRFANTTSIEKIENLQDTMQELTDQIMDVNAALDSEPLIEFDDSELEAELDLLVLDEKSYVATISVPMDFPDVVESTELTQEQEQRLPLVAT